MEIVKEIRLIDDWDPVTIYEPIPVRLSSLIPFLIPRDRMHHDAKDRCVPEELASLKEVLSSIDILRYDGRCDRN
jgi:hypothetical protein